MWVFWSRVGLLFKGNSKENIAGWPIGGATDRSTLDIRWVFLPTDRLHPIGRFHDFCLISTAHILQTVCSCGGAERAFSTARRRRLAARAARGEITKRTRGYGGSCKRECARGRLRARLCLEKGDDARATRSSRETMNTQGVGAMVASGAVRPPRVSRAAHLGFSSCGGLPPRHFYLSARRRGVPGLRRLLPRGAHRPFVPRSLSLTRSPPSPHSRRLPSRRTAPGAPPRRPHARRAGPTRPSPPARARAGASASRRRLAPGARDDVTLPPNRAIYDGPRVDTWSGADAGVEPRIVVEDAGDNDTTLVRCQGFDRTGQLAALTIALSSFGLQIKSTFIRTDNDAPNVDDLFYVQNREGEPVSPSQHAALVAHGARARLGAHRGGQRRRRQRRRLHPRPRTRPRPGRRIRRRFPERRARRRRRILRRLLGRFALRPGGVPLVRIQPRFGGEFGRRVSRRAARTRSSGLEFLRRPAGDGAGWPHGVRRERRGGGQWLFR